MVWHDDVSRDERGSGRGWLIRLALAAIAVVAVAVLAGLTVGVFLMIFAGILLAVFLRSLSTWLAAHTPLGTSLALAGVVLGLAAVVGGGLWLTVPQVVASADEVAIRLPQVLQQAEDRLARTAWGPSLLPLMPRLAAVTGDEAAVLRWGTVVASGLAEIVTYTLLILFFGLFLAVEPDLYVRGLLVLLPRHRRARAHQVLMAVGEALQTYLLAKAASMVVGGVVTTLGLWLLGVPLALPLGLLTALLTFIPVVGPLIALVPALLVALLLGPLTALAVAGLYLAIQAIENYVLKPLVYQQTLSFPPALTLGAQVLMGVLVGGGGVVLASPLAVALFVIVRMLYVEDVMEERVTAPDDETARRPETAAAVPPFDP